MPERGHTPSVLFSLAPHQGGLFLSVSFGKLELYDSHIIGYFPNERGNRNEYTIEHCC